ncbi:hypothetical protein [Deinococcus aquaticus]|uniref:hypothetical protein n=1 Tax=Deinococcus aquaticus TaxID=328692 RepID=UPI003F45D192
MSTLLETEYPSTGVALGNGWDIIANRKTSGNCLVYTTRDDNSQTASVEMIRVHTLYQFLRTTDFNATLNSGSLFGSNSASATYTKPMAK